MNWRSLFLLALVILAPGSAWAKPGYLYPDPILEARLSAEQTYVTAGKESLSAIAYSLYGHRTWWRLIAKRNPQLAGIDGKTRLPKGTRITFAAPFIGDEHVVQEEETLSRIALWRYGRWQMWRKIYSWNRASIKNPNVITPGTTLVFHDTTSLRVAETPKPSRAEPRAIAAARPTPPPPVAEPDPIPEIPDTVAVVPSEEPPPQALAPPPPVVPVTTPPPTPMPTATPKKSASLWIWLALALAAAGGFLFFRSRRASPDQSGFAGGGLDLGAPRELPRPDDALEDRPRYESLLRIPLSIFKKKKKSDSGTKLPPQKAA